VKLVFKHGRYSSQRGYGLNGVELFVVCWPTVRGAGLSISSELPGIARRSIDSTNYAEARELCARLLESWARRVLGITTRVTVEMEEGQ
jgi:hypothetical protein